MDNYIRPVKVRWADLDPNFHLRHSVYYDYGATLRVRFLQEKGITAQFMQERFFGPVILREECIFRKEIRSSDEVTIDLKLLKARADFSRWTFRHVIFKSVDVVSAILTIDGAWIDTKARKLIAPPEEVLVTFNAIPKDKEFEWLVKKH